MPYRDSDDPAMLRSIVVAGAVAATCAFAAMPAAGGRVADRGVVARVIDGDTVTLADGRRIRLVQIDSPELGTGECYSRKARAVLVGLMPSGSRVELEADAELDHVDRYGRLLRYVWHGGRNVNLQMVTAGAAAPYFYERTRGKYADALERAARDARAGGIGLWGACRGTAYDPSRAVSTGSKGRAATSPVGTAAPSASSCDPNYAGGCVPPYPPDLDCDDIRRMGIAPVRVIGADPHRLDGDGDGLGCE